MNILVDIFIVLFCLMIVLIIAALTEKYWIKNPHIQRIEHNKYGYWAQSQYLYFHIWKRWCDCSIHLVSTPRGTRGGYDPFKTEKEARDYLFKEFGAENREIIIKELL